MIRITTTTNTPQGFSVPANSIIKFRTIIEIDGGSIVFELFPYASEAIFDAGGSSMNINELKTHRIVRPVDANDFANLSVTSVHNMLLAELEKPENSSLAGNLETVIQ